MQGSCLAGPGGVSGPVLCTPHTHCRSGSPPQPPEQTRSGAVQPLHVAAVEAGQQFVAQRLAKLDTPLIEAIDIPNYALYEDFMFVESN